MGRFVDDLVPIIVCSLDCLSGHIPNVASGNGLFLLMTVLSQSLLAFVCSHFMAFSLFSAWHNVYILVIVRYVSDVAVIISPPQEILSRA